MNGILFSTLLIFSPAAARAASTGTAGAVDQPAPPAGGAITLFGNPAVMKAPKKTAAPGLVKEVPAEFKGSLPKPVKKKKRRAAPPPPPEKKAEVKPPKRKLVPVSFYDKWEAQRVNCEWYLGKVFIPAYDSAPAQGIDLKWRPDPQPPLLQFGYWREHQQPILQQPPVRKKR